MPWFAFITVYKYGSAIPSVEKIVLPPIINIIPPNQDIDAI